MSTTHDRTVVIYAFHEKDVTVRMFEREGMVEHPDVDYVTVWNHVDRLLGGAPDVKQVKKGHLHIDRCNTSRDWGAYSEAIRQIDISTYKYFVLLNSTMRGPFFPSWYKKDTTHWTQLFTERLNTEIALVGSSINYQMSIPHVQSMLMVFDHRALNLLRKNDIIMSTNRQVPKNKLIWEHELNSSKVVLDAGFNLDCMLTAYQGIDWREKPPQGYPNIPVGCLWGKNRYFGTDIHPYEAIFMKTNREWGKYNTLDKITNWKLYPEHKEEIQEEAFDPGWQKQADQEEKHKKPWRTEKILLIVSSIVAALFVIMFTLSLTTGIFRR